MSAARWAMGLLVGAGAAAAQAEPDRWNFRALLDGTPIGHQSFVVGGTADRRTLETRADFAVKVLGITAYTYHHAATEQWQGDCLASLQATTDDDGRKATVQARRDGETTSVTVSGAKDPLAPQRLAGCVMTFAYWTPRILQASRLLNPQTGKYEAVDVKDLGTGAIDVRGRQVEARHYRLDGPERPVELWYSAAGDWLGLDSMVGKRRLSYRLE